MQRLAAHLPDAAVGLAPDLADEIGDLRQSAAGVGVEPTSCDGVEPGGLHQIAVDVELLLSGGAVADSYWARPAIAGQRQCDLRCALAAVEAVEDAPPRMRQLRGGQQPTGERFGLLPAAQPD